MMDFNLHGAIASFWENHSEILGILHTEILQGSFTQEIIGHFICAFLAGFGFCYGLNPQLKTLVWSAVFAGIGHTSRAYLMEGGALSFAGASFVASLLIGLLGTFVAKRLKAPIEVVIFPALLPMFPGKYGYQSIISLLNFIEHRDDATRLEYLLSFFDNFMIMFSVSLSLVAGTLVVLSIFYEQSFMMTRGIKRLKIREH
ncbi:threonine/serine exporter family protein [Helicobacter sp. 23-1046]